MDYRQYLSPEVLAFIDETLAFYPDDLDQTDWAAQRRVYDAMAAHFPNEPMDFVSLEGYVVAQILCHALERVGRYFTTESLIDELERIEHLDLGIGDALRFHESDHQASHQVWGTVLDGNGHFQALDLERIQLQ